MGGKRLRGRLLWFVLQVGIWEAGAGAVVVLFACMQEFRLGAESTSEWLLQCRGHLLA